MQPDSNRELAAYQAEVGSYLNRIVQSSHVPGICLELSANSWRVAATAGTLAADSALPMTRDARFATGAIGNMLLSLAVLDLAARGKLDVGAPLAKYLHELSGSQIGAEVEVRHLLTHSGGHPSANLLDAEVRENHSWARCLEELCEASLVFSPGTVFSYSPIATVLLQELVHRVAGVPASELIRSRLLAPLHIDAGSHSGDADRPGAVASHSFNSRTRRFARAVAPRLGELWRAGPTDFTMSMADLVTLYEAIVDARNSDPGRADPVHRKSALELQRQVLKLPFVSGGPSSERMPLSSGVGCAEFVRDWCGTNCGPVFGQAVAVRYHAKHRIVLAVGANASVPAVCDSIIDAVLRTLVDELTVPEPVLDESSPSPGELEGTYVNAAGWTSRVSSRGAGIVCDLYEGSNTHSRSVAMELDGYKRWVVSSDPGRWPLGVFRDPTTGNPCFMNGMWASRKAPHHATRSG